MSDLNKTYDDMNMILDSIKDYITTTDANRITKRYANTIKLPTKDNVIISKTASGHWEYTFMFDYDILEEIDNPSNYTEVFPTKKEVYLGLISGLEEMLQNIEKMA